MDVLGYNNIHYHPRNQFQVIKPPDASTFDESSNSFKHSSNYCCTNSIRLSLLSSLPLYIDSNLVLGSLASNSKASHAISPEQLRSPTEEIDMNFPTDNATAAETPTTGGTNTVEGHLLSRVTTMGHNQAERLITTPEELASEDIIEDEVIMRLVSTFMFYILRINTISLITFSLLSLSISWEVSYLYVIGFLWIVDFFELLQMLRHSRKYRYIIYYLNRLLPINLELLCRIK